MGQSSSSPSHGGGPRVRQHGKRNCVGGKKVVKCKKYEHDNKSAMRKATSNVSVSVPFVSKQITGPHNPKTDAYRSCKNCGKHKNFHTKEAVKPKHVHYGMAGMRYHPDRHPDNKKK